MLPTSDFRAPVLAASVLLLSACATTGESIDRDIELSLSPQVASALAAHRPHAAPRSPLVSMSSTTDVAHKANFGRIDTNEAEWVLRWRDDGRLATTVTSVLRTPSDTAQGVTTSTSVCGLVPVLSESASVSRGETSSAIAIGGSIVPFGFSSNRQFGARSRLVSFSTTAPDLCAPEPGSSFSYQFTRELQRKLQGNVSSSNKLFVTTESATCEVAREPQAASDLGRGFSGRYLPVNCTIKDASNAPRKASYAFLLSSGIYLETTVQLNDYQTNTSHYSAAKYE